MKNAVAFLALVGLVAGGIVYGITRPGEAGSAAEPAHAPPPPAACCAGETATGVSSAGPADSGEAAGCCAGDAGGAAEDSDCASCG